MKQQPPEHIKITIPGLAYIKKNNMTPIGHTVNRKTGARIPLSRIVLVYSKAYQEYALRTVRYMIIWKNNMIQKYGDIFPLEGSWFMSCIFYRDTVRHMDISNALEGPQDILTGCAGIKLPKGIDKKDFQIFSDDNAEVVKPALPNVFIDMVNPRTEIFISRFNFNTWSNAFKVIFPDAVFGDDSQEQLSIFKDGLMSPEELLR